MLTITIPTPGDETVFLDIDVTYDVIATDGPPSSPPLDTVLTGWTFVECWRLDPEADDGMSVMDLSELPPRYTQYIDKYVGDNFLVIQENCRDFELTRSDCVV
jgi:hypothetical protein